MTSKALKFGMGAAAVVGAAVVGSRRLIPRFRVEGPHYEVEGRESGIELRRYGPRVVAETTVFGEYRSSLRDGFRRLAGFIFGGNLPRQMIEMTTPVELRSAQRIAMTTPVEAIPAAWPATTSADRNAEEWLISFTMPSIYGPADLPRPNDPRVRISERRAQRFAALRFSGRATRQQVKRKKRALLDRTRLLGLDARGPVSIARYDPPWTPSFLRRNEILVPVN